MTPDRAALRAYATRVRPQYEAALRELVEIPTVSTDPARRADVDRGARAAARLVVSLGGRARVVETSGHPLVLGHFPARRRGRPRVTLYNHLDVQPAAREAEGWTTDPFTFVKEGDRYRGRGTTDDKGPALAALFGVVAARAQGADLDVRLLWETEEEIGSPSLRRALGPLAAELRGHSVVVSDTSWLDRRHPTSTAGLRGMVALRFVLVTAEGDAHSGDVGGAARNPLAELMQVACDLHDPRTGRVRVPGFHDGIVPLTRAQREEYRRCGFSLASFRRDNRLRRLRTTDPQEIMERIWSRPTFEVHGLVGGYTGPGLKAIVPGRAELKASCRLVPGQDPVRVGALIRRYVKSRHPQVEVHVDGGARPFDAGTEGPVPDAVRRAMRFAFGKAPAFVREGGTIGAVTSLQEALRCPIAFLNLSLPEHGYHAPNENFDWGQAEGGMAAFAHYLGEVSAGR